MMTFQNGNGGLLSSVRRISDTAVSIFKNRAELAVLEMKEEKARLISAAIWGGLFIFSSVMAMIAISGTLLFYFWDQKLYVAVAILVFSLIGALVAFFTVKRRVKTPMPFAETIAQLKKDRAWLHG
jgi:uncharacterized membrane protein YqjE